MHLMSKLCSMFAFFWVNISDSFRTVSNQVAIFFCFMHTVEQTTSKLLISFRERSRSSARLPLPLLPPHLWGETVVKVGKASAASAHGYRGLETCFGEAWGEVAESICWGDLWAQDGDAGVPALCFLALAGDEATSAAAACTAPQLAGLWAPLAAAAAGTSEPCTLAAADAVPDGEDALTLFRVLVPIILTINSKVESVCLLSLLLPSLSGSSD
jgi:hypothetical protein